ncbi:MULTISPECIES: HNH endonuclease [Halobacteriales]|uniref:HNH endonuclease n=2 Tax=Halobacteriales TaxID=2235 RepID=A0A1I0QYU4_9EURY|nr:HNH endonuclease [Natrinema salifodinae]SEW33084.1 HNH endonuclease [Natrinema salifodinae]
MSGKSGNELYPEEQQNPWRDKELMEKLYVDEKMAANDIRKLFDCSISTVLKWLDEHGIEKRSIKEAKQLNHGLHANFSTNPQGYEQWRSGDNNLLVHRLLAVAKFGFEEAGELHVHHENGLHWDNRPDNLELVSNEDHQKLHRKVKPPERWAIASLYDATEMSSRDVGDVFGVSNNTVLNVHKEKFGGDAEA